MYGTVDLYIASGLIAWFIGVFIQFFKGKDAKVLERESTYEALIFSLILGPLMLTLVICEIIKGLKVN